MRARSQRGTLVAFLLMLAVIGLIIVLGLIAIELLVKWTTLNRIQGAAQAGALAFARETIKVRDNYIGTTSNGAYNIEFSQVPPNFRCSLIRGQSVGQGCTPVDPTAPDVPRGATHVETMNASQIILFQLRNFGRADSRNRPIKDASQIEDVTNGQCYTRASATRFSLFHNPPRCTGTIGFVVSPITDLSWELRSDPYGQGICAKMARDESGANINKDFCTEAIIRGRLDPIIAGGLPFLTGQPPFQWLGRVQFIFQGDFNVAARAVGMKTSFGIDQGNTDVNNRTIDRSQVDQYFDQARNYSAESIGIEACNSTVPAGANSPCQN